MKLRPAKLIDFTEIVSMYKALIEAVYEDMKTGEDIFFYGVVIDWYKSGKDLTVCESKDGEIVGFTLAYLEDIAVVEPYYYGDIAYIKPEFRKTRAAYLMYNNVVNYGQSLGLKVQAKAYVGGGNKDKVDRLQSRFGKPQFTEFRTEHSDG